jgi:hypothetical protein
MIQNHSILLQILIIQLHLYYNKIDFLNYDKNWFFITLHILYILYLNFLRYPLLFQKDLDLTYSVLWMENLNFKNYFSIQNYMRVFWFHLLFIIYCQNYYFPNQNDVHFHAQHHLAFFWNHWNLFFQDYLNINFISKSVYLFFVYLLHVPDHKWIFL